MRRSHNGLHGSHWTASYRSSNPLLYEGAMVAKHRQEFSRNFCGSAAPETEPFLTLADPQQIDSKLLPNATARKPVASVRPGVTARHSLTALGSDGSPSFEPLLDLREASAVLGMHWKTLEAKARGHEVPAFKVGKRWRFRLSSLNSWLEHGINSNTTDHAVVTRQERCS